MSERCPPSPEHLPPPRRGEVVSHTARLVRIFFRGGPHPTGWSEFRHAGPLATARFDHHAPGTSRAVMYLARRGEPLAKLDGLACALAEVFQASRLIDTITREPSVAWWTPTRPVRLLDLGSAWTTRAGGNQALNSGDRRVARAWARAIYGAFPDLDGLTWTSSVVGPGRNVALTERAADSIPQRPDLLCPLSDPGLAPAIQRAAHPIGYLVA